MIALAITDVRDFMNKLLGTEVFDHFLLQEAVIVKDVTFSIDGHISKDFYSAEELELQGLTGFSFLPYGSLRPHCLSIFKGRRKPLSFKFVFLLSPPNLEKTLASCGSSFTAADIAGIFFNLRYQSGHLLLTTGISYRSFSPDKSLDHEWDRLMKLFLRQREISFEEP